MAADENDEIPGAGADPALLTVYLNDHLAAATGVLELFRRAARATRGTATGRTLAVLTGETADDRQALLDLMSTMQVPVRQYKIALGWGAEKVGRLKLNGRVVSRSPLSTLVELEALRAGVESTLHCWQTLRRLADTDGRLDVAALDELIGASRQRSDRLASLHAAAVPEALRPASK